MTPTTTFNDSEVTSTPLLRGPSIVREELHDLVEYLNGIPGELRHSDAFATYEQRVGELSRELILSETLQFTRNASASRGGHEEAGVGEYGAVQENLSRLAARYQRGAGLRLLASRTVQWSVLLASAGTVASAVAAVGLVLPLSVVATFLAALYPLSRLADGARERQLIADQITTLKAQIANSFGPAGEVLSPSEYYPASTKRIEELIENLRKIEFK